MAAQNTYSTIVSWVKIILPLIALALLSTLFLFADRPDPEDAIIFAEVDVAALAREQRLNEPRFAGTLSDGREILFQADVAVPIPDSRTQFSASGISVRIALDDQDFVVLNAAEALVDTDTQVVQVSGGIDLRRSDGMQLITEELEFSLDRLEANAPAVRAEGRGIEIDAGAMNLTEENGPQVLSFTDGVRVIYQPGQDQ